MMTCDGGDVVAGVALGLDRDRLAQRRDAGGGRVAVRRRLAGRLDGRLDDGRRGREVGLARAEADDVGTGGLERLGLGVDGERGGLGDAADARGRRGDGGSRETSWDHAGPRPTPGPTCIPKGEPRGARNADGRAVAVGQKVDPEASPDVHSSTFGRSALALACRLAPTRAWVAVARTEGNSSIGRVPVSKTGGWGFKSLLPCQARTRTTGGPHQVVVYAAPPRQTQTSVTAEKPRTRDRDTDGRSARAESFDAGQARRPQPGDLHPRGRGRAPQGDLADPPGADHLHSVVIVFVSFIIAVVYGLDYGFTWVVLKVFG